MTHAHVNPLVWAAFVAALVAALSASTAHADKLPAVGTTLGQGLANPSPNKSLKIPNNGVTNALSAQMPARSVKGNSTGSTANPSDLTTIDVSGGYKLNGTAIAQVVAGTTQTVTADQWAAGTTFVVSTASQTLTLPASSTLSANGGIVIQTVGQTVALAPNGSDTINGVNATTTIDSGATSVVTTNASGAVYATPTTAFGSATATASAGAATLNTKAGRVTSEALVGAVSYTLTLTNSNVTTSSTVLVNATNSANLPVTVNTITENNGNVVVLVGMAALTGTVNIRFGVLN